MSDPDEGPPATDYERLMKFIDDVSETIGCPDSDSDPDWALIVRVCAVAKHLSPSTHSDNLNQCVLEEALAICIIERVSRAHANGLYKWCGTAWSKLDGHHFVTMDVKTEWKNAWTAPRVVSSLWRGWGSFVLGLMLRVSPRAK